MGLVPRDIHLSVVSHGHGAMVNSLLRSLAEYREAPRLQVTVTVNTANDPVAIVPEQRLALKFIHNPYPKGYGANHNYAFNNPISREQRRVFVVLNPDMVLADGLLAKIAAIMAANPRTGVIAPAIVDDQRALQQNARRLPGLRDMAARFVLGRRIGLSSMRNNLDKPDWVAGMFMMFTEASYIAVDGFDEGYHLYYEDVDICSRLWLHGYSIQLLRELSCEHVGQWQSRRNLRYFVWHFQSAMRFLFSRVSRRARRFHRQRDLFAGLA